MTFGQHTPLVEEVIAFAKSDGLLRPGEPIVESLHVIRSLEEAKRFASDALIGNEEYTWTDLREKQKAKVLRPTCGNPAFAEVKDALSGTLKTLAMLVRRRLDDQHMELLDDIVGDLFNCAYNRAVSGAEGFFEQLFDAYRAGGWPCGWEGDFPNGKLFVYFPE